MDIFLFVCNCRGTIKIPDNLEFGKYVRVIEHSILCSEHGKKVLRKVAKGGAKIIIAGCTPRIAEKFFNEWNPEIVNIREQVAFVDHNGDKMKD
ncbi:MAG TPA: hypothetical protein EYP60_09620, partial [bacterium (Candidatus Stahlbacteria)]|nr:hypothetical protein [Candidatus Stahlbacteria bacterium]